jgi:hypothetical protein
LDLAYKNLKDKRFGAYNGNIKRLFKSIESCNAAVKEHLQTIMQAARIKKGTVLLQKGLSIGQAAGLMGLSNWDLQQYASKNSFFGDHHEKVQVTKRLATALETFSRDQAGPLFFDAGPIITLVMSRLIWILPILKEHFSGKFYITPAVKYELVERPMSSRRFKFEAIQVMKLIRDGVLEVYDKVPQKNIENLKKIANGAFVMDKRVMDVLQEGEIESIVCLMQEHNSKIVMDERTLRLYLEDPGAMKQLLEHRFKRKVVVDEFKMEKFRANFSSVGIIRSIELVCVAYKLGLLNDYIPKKAHGKRELLDAILWATKFNGCAVTNHEIEEIKKELLG